MTNYRNYFFILYFFISFSFESFSRELKIAVLKFGSVNWELDVLEHHELDKNLILI